jgi:hypothetical protein
LLLHPGARVATGLAEASSGFVDFIQITTPLPPFPVPSRVLDCRV